MKFLKLVKINHKKPYAVFKKSELIEYWTVVDCGTCELNQPPEECLKFTQQQSWSACNEWTYEGVSPYVKEAEMSKEASVLKDDFNKLPLESKEAIQKEMNDLISEETAKSILSSCAIEGNELAIAKLKETESNDRAKKTPRTYRKDKKS